VNDTFTRLVELLAKSMFSFAILPRLTVPGEMRIENVNPEF
jgi:hypothetical protein